MRVVLKLSDPWEMGEALRWTAISGSVVHIDHGCWLIEIDRPFVYDSAEYRFLVVSPRHEGKSLSMAVSDSIPCNMIRTTPEHASSKSPCDVSWWRGGHAMIGSIVAGAAQPGAAADRPQAAGR